MRRNLVLQPSGPSSSSVGSRFSGLLICSSSVMVRSATYVRGRPLTARSTSPCSELRNVKVSGESRCRGQR
ncbi:hypothetical protein L227DRAFT_259877 [Lentinus tigrinus ALCF2SS1-6]|uniref:Uncharacterized protein n=1 Tax=Lentinus tigrinus ALCF2SS1-6 TaxID=1328759 RepID=A0A5C2RZG1_9APHY|nr:hypothetical protein L227DRAFT_259877 [Lentinus tigrinus ALCF2SS1-6]